MAGIHLSAKENTTLNSITYETYHKTTTIGRFIARIIFFADAVTGP
jgi:hypothetical protein